MTEEKKKQWSGRTDGTTWMQRSLIAMLRVVDVRVFYAIMACVVPFYMLFNRNGYRAMRDYFKHRGDSGLRLVWHIYRNHYVFGQIVIDRFAVYAGMKFTFVEEGNELIDRHSERDEGFMMLGSHVGNYELTSCTFDARKKRVNALVYAGESEAIMENRRQILAKHNIGLILVGNDMSHLFQMNTAIDNGEIISMHADRIFGSQKHIICRFLGEDASFPAGPFAFAAQKNTPVYAVFYMKESTKVYHLYVRPIACDEGGNIRKRMNEMAKRYVEVLEEMVNKYPYQWFNYFDFWNTESGQKPVTSGQSSQNNKDVSNTTDIPIDLSDILPQRKPFVMIDGLNYCEGETTETFFKIKKECVFCDSEGRFSEAGIVENIAQTCAARIGYLARQKDEEVKIGVIGAINNMVITDTSKVGDVINTKVVVEEEVFNMTLVRAEVKREYETIATCKMKIALTEKQAER